MASSINSARETWGCRREMRLAGATLIVLAFGLPIARGADSTVRFLELRDQVQPASGNAVEKRESNVRVAAATSPVLGRQESKLVERRPVEPATQAEEFAKAIREAIALRDAINVPVPKDAVVRENRALSNKNSTPSNTMVFTPAPQSPAPTSNWTTPAVHAPTPVESEPTPAMSAPAPVVNRAMPVSSPPARVANEPSPLLDRASSVVVRTKPNPSAPTPVESPSESVTVVPTPMTTRPTPEAREFILSPATPAPMAYDSPAPEAEAPAAVENWTTPAVNAPAPIATAPRPINSVPSSNVAFHPHITTAPEIVSELPAACPTEPIHEEYLLADPLGCAYGPGQSGTQFICGVDCGLHGAPCSATWQNAHYIPWSLFGPGEYVGPSRTEHVSNYYLRVNDLITLTYITSRQKMGERYQLGVGDRLRIESSVDESLDREVQVQPDGEITLPLVGEVMAAGKTVKQLREDLVDVFKEAQRQPQITVTPLEINMGLQEIVKAVTAQIGSNGQVQALRVTPEGTIQAPGIGSIYVQGLTLEELRSELEARYTETYGSGLMITPALTERATSYVFVGGEVTSPGRYTLEGPTTVMQAIQLAGGENNGGNIHQVVIFRRDENWCLKATKIDVHAPLYGKDPCPVNDVWLRDNDLVIIPKSKILCATDVIDLYFTRGVYAVFPVTFFQDLSRGSTVIP